MRPAESTPFWPSQLFLLISARQLGLVDLNPIHPTAPVTMYRRLSRRHIVERARRHDGARAVARSMRDRAVAIAANLPGKTFCLRQVVAFDQVFPLRPTKLPDRHSDIGRAHAACRFAAT